MRWVGRVFETHRWATVGLEDSTHTTATFHVRNRETNMSVKSLSRVLVNKFLVRPVPTPFRHEGGDCWSAPMPALRRYADDESGPRRSTLTLYEDGLPLQQPHYTIGEIRGLGIGRYAHWEDRLYFSSTDNTDPTENDR